MGVSVEAVPSELQSCSSAAGALAEQLGGLGLAGAVDPVSTAFPGTTAAGAATHLGDVWAARLGTLASDVDAHAQRLATSASNYVGTDDYNADALPRPAQ